MTEDYLALIPSDPNFVPEPAALAALLTALESEGVIRKRADGSFESGAQVDSLVDDPNPREIDGENVLTRGGAAVFVEQWDYVRGHAGTNLEPIACVHCHSELPFDEMLDAFESAKGDAPLPQESQSLVCFHCEKGNDALTHEYGISAGFTRMEVRIHVSTGRQLTPKHDTLGRIQDAFGAPLFLIAVLH